jgi:transcriptional regulator with XRE-family HTH domain
MVENSAQEIARLRKKQKLSQAQLATLAGVSQASISRIEKDEQQPDLRLYAKIAKALKIDLSEIVPSGLLDQLLGQDYNESFYAFCPNPFCNKNSFYINKQDGKPYVTWNSGSTFRTDLYDKVNFCSGCGTDLVKECPSCKQRLQDRGTRFCISCGSKISDRPTKEEWKQIEETCKAKAEFNDDDIPF